MAKEEVGKFLEELRSNKDAMDAIAAKNPESLEALAEITGGLAKEQGLEFLKEDLLSFYEDRLRLLKDRTDSASSELTDKDMESVTGGVLVGIDQLMCSSPTIEDGGYGCNNNHDVVFRKTGYKCPNRADKIVKAKGGPNCKDGFQIIIPK